MRKLYNEFFYIPKHGKIREKVMLARIAMTITIMVICLAAMSVTAYAYISYNITSSFNKIQVTNFYTDVTVQIVAEDGTIVEDGNITPITSDHKNFCVEGLAVGKWYSVTITPAQTNTARTGFVIVSAEGCPVTYHTQQLGVDISAPGEYTPAITFKLMITDVTDVMLMSHWGTSSYYSDYQIDSVDDARYINLNEEIKMIVNDHADPNVSEESSETTTTPTTEATIATEPAGTTPVTTEPTETGAPTTATTELTEATETTQATETTVPQLTEETTGAAETEA